MPEESTPEPDLEKRTSILKKIKDVWGQLAFGGSIIGAVVGGYVTLDNKLDEYEQRGVDIVELKRSNESLRAEQRVINERVTTSVNEATRQITNEFMTRDEVDRELRANILAVLNEVRARHGVVTLATPSEGTARRVSIREAQQRADSATARSGDAMPQGDPLSGLDGL